MKKPRRSTLLPSVLSILGYFPTTMSSNHFRIAKAKQNVTLKSIGRNLSSIFPKRQCFSKKERRVPRTFENLASYPKKPSQNTLKTTPERYSRTNALSNTTDTPAPAQSQRNPQEIQSRQQEGVRTVQQLFSAKRIPAQPQGRAGSVRKGKPLRCPRSIFRTSGT